MWELRHGGHWKSLNLTMRTLAPSRGTTIGTRGVAVMKRSNSDCCAWVAAGAEAGVADVVPLPSRGKNASVDAAPPRNSTATMMATGLPMNTRRSRTARRGKVVIGNGVVAPERKNSPTTPAAMIRQSTQTAFNTTNDTYSKYRTTARASVDAAKRYPGTLSRTGPRATRPVKIRRAAPTNQTAPMSATGMPRTVLNRLKYTCVQLTVVETSQKLVYVGSNIKW